MYKLSAANQLSGTVLAVREGAVSGVVTIETPDGLVKADITMEAIRQLGLREGVRATAHINASDLVIDARDRDDVLYSAGNAFEGVVGEVVPGAVNAHVSVTLGSGQRLLADLELSCLDEMGLSAGVPVTVRVGANDVLVSSQA